jgi:CRISPR-associated protein Cas2
MVIMILERVPTGLRGELSRWMIEPQAGVFVGQMSGLVRDKLWDKVREDAHGGAAMLIHSARTEQGFRVQTLGEPSRQPVDVEGLTLIRVPKRKPSPRRPERPGPGDSQEELPTDRNQ